MGELTIAVVDGIKGSGLALLKQVFGDDAIVVGDKLEEEELSAKIGGFDALLVRSATTVTRRAIEAAGPRLKLIGRAGVGTDNIDNAAATERGVIVMNTPFGNTVSAAEQAIALIFAAARNIARADRLMQAGKWEKKSLIGAEIYGKTLGVIGLGKIGQHVAKVMQAAGMRIAAFDPFFTTERAEELKIALLTDLDSLLARADFITLHTPFSDQTRNLIDAAGIAKMKKGVRIVNCARGGIIDEAALAEAVKSGWVAAAGIDVFSTEPAISGPLFGVKDITLTPHLGASTEEAEDRCGLQMAEQVVAFFRDGKVINAVNVKFSLDESLRPYAELTGGMGKIASYLVNAPVAEIDVCVSGDFFADKDCGILRSAAVRGVLERYGMEGVNDVNSMHHAQQRGIKVNLSYTERASDAPRIDHVDLYVRGRDKGMEKETLLSGTVYQDGRKRLIRIDDADIEVRLDQHMLFLRYPDKPGIIGRVGTLLGDRLINIENMQVGILSKLKKASMVLGTSQAVSPGIVDEIRRDKFLNVDRIYAVDL